MNEDSTLKDLEAYKKKVSYGFASQVTQEIKDIVEAFHNGYGCECLSSGYYKTMTNRKALTRYNSFELGLNKFVMTQNL